MKKQILILGGNGFIGSNLIKKLLLSKKYKIRIFDRFDHGISPIIQKNIDNGDCDVFRGDFLNKKDIRKALTDCDYVFHLISMSTPASLYNDLLADIDLNVNSTIRLLNECIDAKIKKFVFVSSGGAIYGDQDGIEKFDETMAVEPISPYAISKVTIEKILYYYKKRNNLNCLILRYSNPFGPGHSIRSQVGLIPIFLRKAIDNEIIEIFGDGNIIRDYIYIDDAIYKTIELFERKTKYNLYNIASGQGHSINDVIKSIKENTNLLLNIKYIEARSADIHKVVLDVKRVNAEVKNRDIDFDKAIANTYKWVLDNSNH